MTILKPATSPTPISGRISVILPCYNAEQYLLEAIIGIVGLIPPKNKVSRSW